MANAKKRSAARPSANEEHKTARSRAEGAAPALLDADTAKRALLQLQDAMGECLVILDSELRVQSANRCFHDYFRIAPRLTRGRRLGELSGGVLGGAGLHALLQDALADGTPFHDFEMERHSADLGQRLLRVSAVRAPNEGGAPHSLFLTIMDITDRRRSQTIKSVEERERSQRRFIANVSHELRTPVTAIKGYAQTLLQGGLDDREHRRTFVKTIERNADRLARLIADLLRISKLSERAAPRRRPVRLADAVRRCLSERAAPAKAAKVAMRAAVPPGMTVAADREQLLGVLGNLIGNAVKFNRPGGRVLVKARAARHEAVIVVEDTGIGLLEQDLERLFERFYRGGNARTRRGAGLGLSIAQQIVAAHGGRIWAENRKGGGAAFHFTLPLWNKSGGVTPPPGRTGTPPWPAAARRPRRGR